MLYLTSTTYTPKKNKREIEDCSGDKVHMRDHFCVFVHFCIFHFVSVHFCILYVVQIHTLKCSGTAYPGNLSWGDPKASWRLLRSTPTGKQVEKKKDIFFSWTWYVRYPWLECYLVSSLIFPLFLLSLGSA